MLVGIVVGTLAAVVIGPMIVRLRGVYFAMVHDRLRPGVLFHRLSAGARLTGGDDGVTGWKRMPLDLGFATIDILNNDKAFYYLRRWRCSRSARRLMALLLRSPFGRTLLAIRENERRARFLGIPVERHIWLSFVISCFFVSLAGTLYRAAQQFRRSARAALGPVGQFRHHGGARRHALVLGAADRRGDLRGAAGLDLQPHRELDVVHRPVLRAGRAVLPARRARHHSTKGGIVSLLQVENVSQALRQPGRRRRCVADGRARRAARRDRPQRRRQDHLLQPDQRLLPADLGPHPVRRRDVTELLPARRVWRGMARTFQITEIFPELTVRENLRIAVEVASRLSAAVRGCRRRPTARSAARVDELAGHGRPRPKRPTGWSASCRTAISAPPRS